MVSKSLSVDPSQIHLFRPLQHPMISPKKMTAEHDIKGAVLEDHDSVPFWNHCLLCGTDLEQDWPDLSELDPSDIKNHAHDEWRRAAETGCPFCSIVVAVIDDAGKQHGCSIPDKYHNIKNTGSPTDNDKKGFQVILERNGSTGRYLLALELVWMPLLVEPGKKLDSEFWGTITVYLDGTLFLLLLAQSPFLSCGTSYYVFPTQLYIGAAWGYSSLSPQSRTSSI